jgi:hypothetical protein
MLFWAKVIAWVATALCALLSARCATIFARNSPRVFTILALFSFNWALLIPYYSESSPSELLAGFAGYMLVYIGVLLRRQARHLLTASPEKEPGTPDTPEPGDSVARGDRIALSLLVLLIVPSLISLPVPPDTFALPSRLYTEPIISSVITLIGYYSVWSALRIYSDKKIGMWLMVAVLIIYTVTEVIFTGIHLNNLKPPCTSAAPTPSPCPADYWRNGTASMRIELYIAFAVLKMAFTSLFIWLVLDKSLSDEDKKLRPIDKLLKLGWN